MLTPLRHLTLGLSLCVATLASSLAQASLEPQAWQVSRKYSDIKAFMREIVAKYPQNAQLFELGKNDAGETLEGLILTRLEKGSDGKLRAPKNTVKNLVVATHHGNEYGSTEVAKAVALSLAESPLVGQTIYVIPVLNAVGYDKRSRWEKIAGAGQLDPNRDYPGPCGTEGPFRLKSTTLLADFVAREEIVAAATLHTHAPAVLYPWGISTQDLSTPYDDLFIELGKAATVESGYQVGNSTAVLYAADGTFEDYAFWKHGVWSLLFEVGYSHSPSDKDVAELIRVNVPGIRRMMEQAPRVRAEKHDFTGKCDTSPWARIQSSLRQE